MTLTIEKTDVKKQAKLAQDASKKLRMLSTEEKNKVLYKLADHLEENMEPILEANSKDLEAVNKKALMRLSWTVYP